MCKKYIYEPCDKITIYYKQIFFLYLLHATFVSTYFVTLFARIISLQKKMLEICFSDCMKAALANTHVRIPSQSRKS